MSKELTPFSISAPGFYGINTQDSSLDMNPAFALEAVNCVIDQYGRIGSRKGWTKSATTSIAANIECIGELIGNDGASYILCAGGNKFYIKSSATLVELTYGGGGVAPTITTSNWQFVSFNNIGYFFQRGYDTIIFDPAVSTTTYRRVSEKVGYAAPGLGVTYIQCNTGISAYGRIWMADITLDKNKVVFSDLLSGHVYTGGTSGYLDVAKVWPNGADEIVSLAAHNGFLIIFGKRQIIIYEGAYDLATTGVFKLHDTISTVGCIARDSVQNAGDDLIFLGNGGVYSLRRLIQEKANPLRDLSKNVRDHLKTDIDTDYLSNIKSIYSDIYAFYLLALPNTDEVYCFDMRNPLEDGSARVTRWTGMSPKSFCQTRGRVLHIGQLNFLGEYSGYLDNASTYTMKYYTPYINFGGLSSSSILKKISLVIIGGSGQNVNIFYAADYSTNYNIGTVALPAINESYFNVSYFNNNAYFTDGISLSTQNIQAGGAGKVIQFGFETTVNGYQVSFQKLDIFTKIGKML